MLVGKLFDGPVDIVGDIHGEVGPLEALLKRLGYEDGIHPEGRRLVFVGDLLDRGPDSPGVLRLVIPLVEAGKAQLILGNHELNLLRGEKKHGNHWFWGAESERLCNPSPEAIFQVVVTETPSKQVPFQGEEERAEVLAFLRRQPLALEREGLCVVHAMWDQASIEKLRAFQGDAGEAFKLFQDEVQKKLDGELRDASKDERDMAEQNENPVNVLTTGMERPAKEPFFAGGKMRTLERYRWWEEYEGEHGMVVIGHYWRRLPAERDLGIPLTGPALFPQEGRESACAFLGKSGKVMCVDYSVGLRYEERGRDLPVGSLGTALAALRLPEQALIFAEDL